MISDNSFNYMVRSSHYRSSHDKMTVNNELFRRKQSWCNFMNYKDIFLEQLRKTMRKTMARVTCPCQDSKSVLSKSKSDTLANLSVSNWPINQGKTIHLSYFQTHYKMFGLITFLCCVIGMLKKK